MMDTSSQRVVFTAKKNVRSSSQPPFKKSKSVMMTRDEQNQKMQIDEQIVQVTKSDISDVDYNKTITPTKVYNDHVPVTKSANCPSINTALTQMII